MYRELLFKYKFSISFYVGMPRLRIEVIVCSVALIFVGVEIILSGAMIWTLQR